MLVGLALIIFAYLVGSIPVGLLVGKVFRGIDIRERGSGNVGATNAYRVLGPVAGVAVFAADVAKGALPVWIALQVVGGPISEARAAVLVLTGMAAIAGHNWSLYLGFQGGKGVSTAAGVLLVLFPITTLILLVIWVVVVAVTRYISVASIVISIAFPLLTLALNGDSAPYLAFSLVAAAVVVFKHRSNIGRVLAGTEPRVWSKE